MRKRSLSTTVTGCTKKRSSDFEDISMDTVAKVVSVICKPLAHICNISFRTGVFPSKMKIAKVIPMFKSGTETDVTNYRPISLLPQFSKILEKLFLTRINSFLCANNILSSSQYGFRTNLSTSLAVMELIEEITNATDNKKLAIGVFIDLKKAFDTVDHRILIKKLEHYGVRGAASDWLKSYLSNRKQFVNIDGCSSELLDVICGVPQGSILGPTLFILYINDICNVSNLVKFILFADDTNVFCVDLFCESLEQIFSDVMPRKSMFICGDFNIDLMKYETHNGTKRFLDCMYGLGLYPLIDRPSRITTHSCTLIDNIFTNQINYSIRSGLLMNDITDHLPIFALCNYEIKNKKSDPVKYVRNLKNENVSLLIESLSQEMWNNVLQSDDVNVAYMNFIETFSKLYNLHCPVKKAHAKGIYKKPWITNGLKNACRKKNGLYRSFLRERTHTSENRYKKYKNKLTSILRLAEKAYYSKMLLEKRGNIKETWAILNTVLGKQRKSVNYPTHLMQRDIHITSKENMANEFNTFFY